MELILKKGSDALSITILRSLKDKWLLRFSLSRNGQVTQAPLEGLRFSYSGIITEFPDLKNLSVSEAKKEALNRLNKKIKSFDEVNEVKEYLKEDLKKHGYTPLMSIQGKGFRPRIEK